MFFLEELKNFLYVLTAASEGELFIAICSHMQMALKNSKKFAKPTDPKSVKFSKQLSYWRRTPAIPTAAGYMGCCMGTYLDTYAPG